MAPKKKNQKKKKDGTSIDSTAKKGLKSTQPQFGVPVVATVLVAIVSVCLFFASKNFSAKVERDSSVDTSQCGIWIAKSTLPNAGLGMFAGRNFAAHQELGVDRVVPIMDMDKHQGSGWPFLWNSYTWNAQRVGMEANRVDLTLHGFGSTANAHMDLNNVIMESTQSDSEPVASSFQLDRNKDSGAGASTPYFEVMVANEVLKEGQELFMSYGDPWFIKRTSSIGKIPLLGDVHRANTLFQDWDKLRKKHGLSNEAFQEFWETFVWKSDYKNRSRILAALPQNWTSLDRVLESDLRTELQHQSTAPLEWLEQNGICGDNFKPGMSQIPQAGRGAFATRALTKDSIVAPLPLIHVPYRQKLDMYGGSQKQLLLNYCYGHRQSTLLLCPYGVMTSYINHNKERPNVKIQWPTNLLKSSSHNPEWLDLSVNDLWSHKQHAGLAFEMVALRDIEEGEEILLDYGNEWEDAWQTHNNTYRGSGDGYVPSMRFNDETILKTETEQNNNPYPSTTQIMLNAAFVQSGEWRSRKWSRNRTTLLEWLKYVKGTLIDCQILDRQNGFYKVRFSDGRTDHVADGLPREAFEFRDKPYSSDLHLPNAFRHDIRIPTDMFPDAWKNIN